MSYPEIGGMGLFTGFLKAAWAVITTAAASWIIILGWATPDPSGSIWILMGVFILGLVAITVWFSTFSRWGAWP